MPNYFRLAIYMALIALFAWLLYVLFPGSYSGDSWYYYSQMAKVKYNDWHSPVISYVWRGLHSITGVFYSIYLAQMGAYLVLFYLMLRLVEHKITLVLGLGLFVLFIFIPQMVMKDTHLVMAWGVASVLLVPGLKKRNPLIGIVILLSLIYGLFIRPNLAIAIIPLLYVWVEQYVSRKNVWVKSGVVAGILVLSFIGYYQFTYNFLKAERAYPEYKLKLLDIAGISKRTGVNYMPECITSSKDYNGDTVMQLYTPATFDHIYWPASGKNFVPQPTAFFDSCATIGWKKAIAEHPLTYLANRWEGFMYYLRIKKRVAWNEYGNVAIGYMDPNNPLSLRGTSNETAVFLSIWFYDIAEYGVYEPWLYLLLNTVFFIVFFYKWRTRSEYHYKVAAFIQLSAIVCVLTQFPVFQHDRDFRYNYWNAISCVIGFLYCFRHRYWPAKR